MRRLSVQCLFLSLSLLGGCAKRSVQETQQCDLGVLYQAHEGTQWSHKGPIWVDCECSLPKELRAVEHAKPEHDADAAMARGDTRLIGIMEYALVVPGVRDHTVQVSLGVRVIEGTSDVDTCYEKVRLTYIAKEYAEAYNRHLIAELPRH